GAGWTLAGLERLYHQSDDPSDDEVLLADGDGTTTVFENPLNKWRKGPALPEARGYLSATALPDGIHILGGTSQYSGFGNTAYIAHHVFDPRTGLFTERAPMPDYFTGAQTAVVLNGKIYQIGFYNRVYDP